MIRAENFIYFFTVSGFFIGLIFSVMNFSMPENILLYTGGITLFFYLFVHIVVMNFVDARHFGSSLFNKREYEEVSEYFVTELDGREKRMDSLLIDLDNMNKAYTDAINKEEEKRKKTKGETYKAAA